MLNHVLAYNELSLDVILWSRRMLVEVLRFAFIGDSSNFLSFADVELKSSICFVDILDRNSKLLSNISWLHMQSVLHLYHLLLLLQLLGLSLVQRLLLRHIPINWSDILEFVLKIFNCLRFLCFQILHTLNDSLL